MPPETGRETLTPADVAEVLGVSRETLARLEIYADLLQDWNRRINLVAPRSLPDLWRRHMLDSAQLWPLLPPAPADRPRRLVDLGSGAGFPGLVLAILGAGEVHLIDSDQRKAAFLREAARATATPVTVHAARLAAVPALRADVVTARALAPLPRLLELAAPFLGPDAVALFPKGRGVAEELTAAAKAWKIALTQYPSRTDPGGTILYLEGIGCGDTKS